MTDKALVFDIQGFSVHDGPGTRTLLFLSGCPLNCDWCANPEGRNARPCLLYAKVRCHSVQDECKKCVKACPFDGAAFLEGAVLPELDWNKCSMCQEFSCTKVCDSEALRVSGRFYTQQELMAILNRDKRFWGPGGGVTFGGGEPLMQGRFLLGMLKECRRQAVHTAVETCGYAPEALFLAVMDCVDFAFVDLKHMEPEEHQKKTGVSNEQILNNLRAFGAISSPKTRLLLRMPVIPDFNDSHAHAELVIAFMKAHSYFEINLLPFHRMGLSKWEQLGLTYPYQNLPNQNGESLLGLQKKYLDAGIACYVDTDVLYGNGS